MPLRKIAQITISSSLDRLADIDRFTEATLRQLGLPSQILDDVAITVSEAVNNAIVHGNKLDPAKRVKVAFYRGAKYLRLVVQDEGAGFAPEKVPDPRCEENLLKTSGRGLLIIRHLMDRMEFHQRKSGMQIVLDKYFQKA